MDPEHANTLSDMLVAARNELATMATPRLGLLVDIVVEDFDVDLYYEEDELSGLVDGYLAGRALTGQSIILDPTVDEGIARAAIQLPGDPTIAAFANYRGAMRTLATLLSQAAGIPVSSVRRNLSGQRDDGSRPTDSSLP